MMVQKMWLILTIFHLNLPVAMSIKSKKIRGQIWYLFICIYESYSSEVSSDVDQLHAACNNYKLLLTFAAAKTNYDDQQVHCDQATRSIPFFL